MNKICVQNFVFLNIPSLVSASGKNLLLYNFVITVITTIKFNRASKQNSVETTTKTFGFLQIALPKFLKAEREALWIVSKMLSTLQKQLF